MVDRKALKANPLTWALLKADPLAYAFEAMLINQFHDATTEDGNTLYYLINTTYCASSFPTISVSGDTILSTFNYASTQHAAKKDIEYLGYIVLALFCAVYVVLVLSGDVTRRFCRFCAKQTPKVIHYLLVAPLITNSLDRLLIEYTYSLALIRFRCRLWCKSARLRIQFRGQFPGLGLTIQTPTPSRRPRTVTLL